MNQMLKQSLYSFNRLSSSLAGPSSASRHIRTLTGTRLDLPRNRNIFDTSSPFLSPFITKSSPYLDGCSLIHTTIPLFKSGGRFAARKKSSGGRKVGRGASGRGGGGGRGKGKSKYQLRTTTRTRLSLGITSSPASSINPKSSEPSSYEYSPQSYSSTRPKRERVLFSPALQDPSFASSYSLNSSMPPHPARRSPPQPKLKPRIFRPIQPKPERVYKSSDPKTAAFYERKERRMKRARENKVELRESQEVQEERRETEGDKEKRKGWGGVGRGKGRPEIERLLDKEFDRAVVASAATMVPIPASLDTASSSSILPMKPTPSSHAPPTPQAQATPKGNGSDPHANDDLPSHFTSPPLLPGLVASIHDQLGLGKDVRPSGIQALSLKWVVSKLMPPSFGLPTASTTKENPNKDEKETDMEAKEQGEGKPEVQSNWRQFLLASETGSGKSIAYLMPLIQYLKETEQAFLSSLFSSSPHDTKKKGPKTSLNPRALVLAPTHELTRQLAGFAKGLSHNVKLRVVCASRANVNVGGGSVSSSERRIQQEVGPAGARKMKQELDDLASSSTIEGESKEVSGREIEIKAFEGNVSRPVDIVVATPDKVLEMVRGWGWDRDRDFDPNAERVKGERRRRKWIPGPPEMGLENVEFVVVDEADVLYDRDFRETLLNILSDISAARGHPISIPPSALSSPINPTDPNAPPVIPIHTPYPFHLILTSATIPSSLAKYLAAYHTGLARLVSPNLHRLPATLRTEHFGWTSSNKKKDIERKIRQVWAEDTIRARANATGFNWDPLPLIDGPPRKAPPQLEGKIEGTDEGMSKVLVFCNKSNTVEELGEFLESKGIKNIAMTSRSEGRKMGSNKHIQAFLKGYESTDSSSSESSAWKDSDTRSKSKLPKEARIPHVLITTSLLSRGLDFSPDIKHVFIMDPPRNMVDFLHRAGRAARAGKEGKVVVFGKMRGRGSGVDRDMRRKVGALR